MSRVIQENIGYFPFLQTHIETLVSGAQSLSF